MKYLLLVLFFALYGCSNNENDIKTEDTTHTEKYKVNFSIVSDEKKTNIKRVVKVNLSERITENELKDIATQIKNEDKNKYQRTFILFFIPEIKNSAWSTVNFNPNLVVNFNGSTKDDHQKLSSKNINNEGELIGQWNANWGYEYKILFEQNDDKIFKREIYADGEQPAKELTVINVKGRKGYQDERGKDNGEYYVINKDGNLEFWSKNGNYYTAKKFS